MATRIPDLWHANDEDASRLYALFLAHLAGNNFHERVVSVCRQIRRYAARGPGRAAGLFTFHDEIDALCDLKQYRTAWRQLRLREEIIYGRRFDLAKQEGPAANPDELESNYTPLLFFLKRYQQGCSLRETSLDVWFDGRKVQSYPNIVFSVYNSDEEPWHRCRVTLSHFYNRLGKSLLEWRHWEAFVNGFHEKLFRLAGVRRSELLTDAGQLPAFFDTLMSIRDERVPTRVGGGLAALTDSPRKVKKRQDAIRKKSSEFNEVAEAKRQQTDTKLRELFPELRQLPSRLRRNGSQVGL